MKIAAPDYKAAEIAIKNKLEKDLPDDLSYHGLHHTMDVMQAGLTIAETENISDKDMSLLRLAILLHDSGFTTTYRGHEEAGCEIAKKDASQVQNKQRRYRGNLWFDQSYQNTPNPGLTSGENHL